MAENAYLQYLNTCKNFTIIIAIMLFAICAILCILSVPVSAKSTTYNSTISVNQSTDTSITWDVEYLTANRPLGATFDGTEIEGFNLQFNSSYTARELMPNTLHKFCVYGSATINCEYGNTTSTKSTTDNIMDVLYKYIWLIGIFICALVGVIIKKSEPFMIGALIAFIGLSLNADFMSLIIYGLAGAFCFALSFEHT